MLQEGLDGVGVDGIHQRGDGHGAHEAQQTVQAAWLAVAACPRSRRHLTPSPYLLLLLLLLQLLHQSAGVNIAGSSKGRLAGVGDRDVAHGHVVGRAEAVAVGG